jgi:hypothetical protein
MIRKAFLSVASMLLSTCVAYAQVYCPYPGYTLREYPDRSCVSSSGDPCPEHVYRDCLVDWLGMKSNSWLSHTLLGSYNWYEKIYAGCAKGPRIWKECKYYNDPVVTSPGRIVLPGWDSVAAQGMPSACWSTGGLPYPTPPVFYIPWVTCKKGTMKSKADSMWCPQCYGDYDCPIEAGSVYYCNSSYECQLVGGTPIIISERGNGIRLTDADGGVNFDLNGNGTAEHIAWTVAGSDDAFLALDRNGNGTIDDGAELFGNFTPQPVTLDPNGFLALAALDSNDDGFITAADSAYDSLRMWTDINHDGLSQSDEMKGLAEFGIASITLDYRLSERADRYGNRFRYISSVDMVRGRRLAVDVVLVVAP